MAIRARLAAPPPPAADPLPGLAPKWTALASHLLWKGARRLEAETYLSSGYGLRLAMEERAVGWVRFGQIARVWQPPRLKGTLVSSDVGTPFFAATQLFDIRPVPRKWLALERTGNATSRYLTEGSIVVTCSGAVGRTTLAYAPHANTLISHDLLRVDCLNPEDRGWIYAYLRSPQARAMMTSVQYGHIIKHLECSHLNAMPVPVVRREIAADFQERTRTILSLRNRAHQLALGAEGRFAAAIGNVKATQDDTGFEVSLSALAKGRRRLEAAFHAPEPTAILRRFKAIKAEVVPLSDVTQRVWWEKRFRRFYGEAGIPYLSADELFTANPDGSKRILVVPDDGHEDFYVKRGWLIMACSGQIYGLNGAACLMTKYHENTFFSHDLIRIVPNTDAIRPGYLLTTLTHPTLGRPLLIRAAYGTSIPHLDPGDVSAFPVVRLSRKDENAIADLAEESAAERAKADMLERELGDDAGKLMVRFLAGETEPFVTVSDAP
jgi:type I restriction enzyme, S subunit